MIKIIIAIAAALCLLASCKSTRNIQTAISKKDTTGKTTGMVAESREDSLAVIRATLEQMYAGKIDYTTFSAKINVDYQGADDKKYDVTANLRMYKDSAIWVSISAIFGVEALRAYITRDSVKLLNKQDKVYIARSVSYLQEITALPLSLLSLQEILIGNPVFVDTSNIISYTKTENTISLLSIGDWFKNLLTIGRSGKVAHSKLDDADLARSRTCNLIYDEYENKKGVDFASKRRITVAEKTKLDIKLNFRQYEFNETLSFPFSVPKNYKWE